LLVDKVKQEWNTFQEGHNARYLNYINALSDSKLSDFSNTKTTFILDAGTAGQDINVSSVDIQKNIQQSTNPNFILSLGGSAALTGGPGNDYIEAVNGSHILTGGGGVNFFQVVSGTDIIADFDYNKDALYIQSYSPITGKIVNGSTVLTYTDKTNTAGTVTLQGQDLSSDKITWIQWQGNPTGGTAF